MIPSKQRIVAILHQLDTPTSGGYPMHTMQALDQLHTICNNTLGHHPTQRRNENLPYLINRTLQLLHAEDNPHTRMYGRKLAHWVESQEHHLGIRYLPIPCPTCQQQTLTYHRGHLTCQQCGTQHPVGSISR